MMNARAMTVTMNAEFRLCCFNNAGGSFIDLPTCRPTKIITIPMKAHSTIREASSEASTYPTGATKSKITPAAMKNAGVRWE